MTFNQYHILKIDVFIWKVIQCGAPTVRSTSTFPYSEDAALKTLGLCPNNGAYPYAGKDGLQW